MIRSSALCSNLLPEGKKEHTSPRQTAFPNWAKQFHFQHVDKDDLMFSGLEVLLCDSHLLYNSTIAGIRYTIVVRMLFLNLYALRGSMPVYA